MSGRAHRDEGNVGRPDVRANDTEIVVSFEVSPGSPRAATCQGNRPVRFEVALGESLRNRRLVDGGCASQEIASRYSCRSGGVRWEPLRFPGPQLLTLRVAVVG